MGAGDASFVDYARLIDDYADESFDLVAVDGRARCACVWHARAKVKPGGYLMLDNSDRPFYDPARQYLSDWEKRDLFGPGPYVDRFWGTTFWRRPAQ